MDLNTILTVTCLVAVAVFVIIMYLRSKNITVKATDENLDSFDKIVEHVNQNLSKLDYEVVSSALPFEEYKRAVNRKARVTEALLNCVHGIETAKIIVTDLIRHIIAADVKPEAVTKLLGLDADNPAPQVMFEILLYRHKKKQGKNALSYLIDKYSWDMKREDKKASYYITEDDLTTTYALENITLTFEEQLDVLALLIFQQYKGFGVVDAIREMDIDGLNIGVSGSKLTQRKSSLPPELRIENSVWIYYQGKHIHLRFLSCESQNEVRRIVQGMLRYDSRGALTRNVGKMVVTAPDESRITALCPPASATWACFVRKFGVSKRTPEELIIKPYIKNGILAVKLLEFIMRGETTCAITGQQGTGKTTLLGSIVRYIDPRHTIRTLETAFELYLSEAYPERNILSVQETAHLMASELQDVLKKTDAAVSMVGEVAQDIIALRMVQMAQVASLFTLFTHHAITAWDLVKALRNSIVTAGGFSNMETAEKQIVDILKINIHLGSKPSGERYIERITEIIPVSQVPYPKYDHDKHDASISEIQREYYMRQTDREMFKTNDIMRYNLETDTYELCGWFSENLESHMCSKMGKEYAEEFMKLKVAV